MRNERAYELERAEERLWRAEREHGLTRRRLIAAGALSLPLLGSAGAAARALAQVQPAPGPIVKPLPPELFIPFGTNAEMRWEALRGQGLHTPIDRFFVRNHTSTPLIDAAAWRLTVFGTGVRRSCSFSLRDLERLPSRSLTAFVECAGNGRSFFASQQGTPATGTPWKLGAVGVARWRGVPLGEVLERAGLRRRAMDVMPEGLDAPVVAGGVDRGRVRRPLPVDKALDDVLLAYEMNGEELPPDHGHPVRLVVPGWVGIASIKWVGAIEVADRALFSYWNTDSYRLIGGDYPPDSPPLTEQPVKSAFELAWDAQLPAGHEFNLSGRSWSGGGPIAKVEVSSDGGRSWRRARLRPPNRADAWARWSVGWKPPGPGRYELLARATDRAGQIQPDSVPFNSLGYQYWAVVRHPVTVT